MELTASDFFMIIGFLAAAYAIVANDALQTIGTFLTSNAHRPWWQLFLFAGGILVAVMVYGFVVHNGDVSYGRLDKIPRPDEFTWLHALPPFVLLILTRFGMPVSTTFMVLSVFAHKALGGMLIKSLMGYAVAFTVAVLLYLAIAKLVERRFQENAPTDRSRQIWTVAQWASTGFLWSQWLIQDLANIFVYLPRQLSGTTFALGLLVTLALLAFTFAQRGGKIQEIINTKTNTMDVRSATLIDLSFGAILLFFKELSNLPMSTTWVFLGLLAGREVGLYIALRHRSGAFVFKDAASDLAKASLGLAISVGLALAIST